METTTTFRRITRDRLISEAVAEYRAAEARALRHRVEGTDPAEFRARVRLIGLLGRCGFTGCRCWRAALGEDLVCLGGRD